MDIDTSTAVGMGSESGNQNKLQNGRTSFDGTEKITRSFLMHMHQENVRKNVEPSMADLSPQNF